MKIVIACLIIRSQLRADERKIMDDRFEKDSTVFNKPDSWKESTDWSDSMTPLEYFAKAFSTGNQNHPKVLKLKQFFERAYKRAEESAKNEKA